MMRSAVAFSILGIAEGHGALVNPPSRNAIDREISGFRPAHEHCDCANTTLGCRNAQACFWYSQGCSIGCPTCDTLSGRFQKDLCGNAMNATITDPMLRSVNRAAPALSALDVYQHNPWRAPGSAPVQDACGMAGGTKTDTAEWAWYDATRYAKKGDLGSKVLPEYPSSTIWKAGGLGEVTWQVTANHGGGYSYRLCPASGPLTEECFQKYPLKFASPQSIVSKDGKRMEINGTYTTEGTTPRGSMWALNPIPPRCLSGDCRKGKPCRPASEDPLCAKGDCTPCDDTPGPAFPPPCDEATFGACSGNEGGVAVVDNVQVPANLKPGKYVLGWRWDCEATAQIWSNCADITVAPADAILV
mmetsp:Transcript_117046/g.342835  ORF Transcript_117046/g.342835 Transcript_117046/m.342835 type:complete len:359 (+) Transcript_117046:60-1136(+)